MSGRCLDSSWKAWLYENIERKCDARELLKILIANNFELDSIKESMGTYFPLSSSSASGHNSAEIDYPALCEVCFANLRKHANVECFQSNVIQLCTIDSFMSEDECDAIAEVIVDNLRQSTISSHDSGPSSDAHYRNYRTSRTSDLSLLRNDHVEEIDYRMSRALGINLTYSEGIQGQYYDVGQEFKQHTDFFEPGTEEYLTYAGQQGNRTWTFMVYLNNVIKGGGTRFINIKRVIEPRKGRAVIWNNLLADGTPNYETLHAGLPVIAGHKTIITKWFRENGAGPMFLI